MSILQVERVDVLERLIAERRWTEIDPVDFLGVFESLSENARASASNASGCSDCGSRSRRSLERLVTAAAGGSEPAGVARPKLQMPDYAYLAEIGEQLEKYQQGAAALAVFEAMKGAAGGDSTAVLEERIFAEMASRRERALRFDSERRNDRGILSEAALRITAAAAARELMLAYRPLVARLKTEAAIRRHFGINEKTAN